MHVAIHRTKLFLLPSLAPKQSVRTERFGMDEFCHGFSFND